MSTSIHKEGTRPEHNTYDMTMFSFSCLISSSGFFLWKMPVPDWWTRVLTTLALASARALSQIGTPGHLPQQGVAISMERWRGTLHLDLCLKCVSWVGCCALCCRICNALVAEGGSLELLIGRHWALCGDLLGRRPHIHTFIYKLPHGLNVGYFFSAASLSLIGGDF